LLLKHRGRRQPILASPRLAARILSARYAGKVPLALACRPTSARRPIADPNVSSTLSAPATRPALIKNAGILVLALAAQTPSAVL